MSPAREHPHACPHCDQGFAAGDHLTLHLGRVHPDQLDEAAQARYEQALAREEAWLERFRGHVRGGLAALPVLLLYGMIVLVGVVMDANPALTLLPLPGVLLVCAFFYYLGLTHERDREPELG